MERPVFRDLRDPKVWDSGEWNEWDWVATDQKSFRLAFETLVAAGCDKWVLLDLLGLSGFPNAILGPFGVFRE